jgi:hypothetical protein
MSLDPSVKQRHGCLTATLLSMVVINSLTAIVSLFLNRNGSSLASWVFLSASVMGLFNVVCAIALFYWKKWGFWGFCASSILTLILNVSAGVRTGPALLGILGPLFLFGVLQIGNGNKGWPQLK